MRINKYGWLNSNDNNQLELFHELTEEIKDNDAQKFQYLLMAYDELRDELKMRIQQRDNLAIQFIVIVGVLSGIAFTDYPYAYFTILIIPLMTLFFSIQIFSSYEVHDRLVKFIREHIEVELGHVLNVDDKELYNFFWEQYCKQDRIIHNVKMPGGRKVFFQMLLKIVPFLCSVSFFFKCYSNNEIDIKINAIISVVSFIIYLIWGYYYLYRFNIKPKKVECEKLSACDYIKKIRRVNDKQKAVFFDRDGTLHVDKVETTLEKGFELFPDTIRTLKEIKKRGYRIIIVTNQSGIAKGHITLKQMKKFNRKLRLTLKRNGCKIDAIYYCPHKNSDNCKCAKPNSGMLDRARMEFNIDIKKSYIVGDKIGDIKAANNAGIPSSNWCLVTTGIYENADFHNEPDLDSLNPKIFPNLESLLEEIK